MKIPSLIGMTILGATAFTSANSRSIVYDDWTHQDGTGSGNSITLNPSQILPDGKLSLPDGITSLILTPGSSASTYSIIDNGNLPWGPTGDMFVWTSANPNNQPADEQIEVVPTSSKLTIDFNYDAVMCGGEVGTLRLNNTTYRASSPCSAGIDVGANQIGITSYNSSEFVFDVSKGKVQLEGLPTGWTAVSAPELDGNTAATGITLLLGSIAVVLGRRERQTRV
jgi:hypothetical protein